ncbi:MAG: hypothetical protein KJ676_11895 [Alphaproteobacteria bacterium]|nr:hypothetical protein [Alphaproteobacteria bacterium]MBU1526965.1 hypothetical protein [Alphaproteobacteria bacterium]MBU2351270.1 hypothetical protein [Alphaproteobacteria bacterium]MBU2381419.1 hypothetical protein [Alphaproteobacteria bacterium]
MFRLIAALIGALAVTLVAGAAAAQTWLRAESPNFIIYSDGGERELREYVTKLERFDQILRFRFNVPMERPTLRRLPIYLVDDRAGLRVVWPDMPETVAGFYTPSEEDVFAVAIRGEGDEFMLHEYAHHFFFQHLNAPYPGWLTEGLAEYVMTAEIRNDSFMIGRFNTLRFDGLNSGGWIPIETLLTARPQQVEGAQARGTYYPVAWLLTHWFFATPERSAQLDAYIRLVAQGVDPVEAFTQATGLAPRQVTPILRGYLSGNLKALTYEIDYQPFEVSITRLGGSARDLLLQGQRIKRPVPEADRAAVTADIRRRAARHPDDPLALLVLGHAELHMGDAAAGEAALLRVLELDPDNDEALQYLATGRLSQADKAEDPEQRRALLAQARGFLARAYRIDPDDYFTLLLITRTREGQPGYPNDNDMLTWEAAFDGAPQLAVVRLGYARALIAAERRAEAVVVLMPLANSPHGGPAADQARALMAEARGEVAPPADPAPEPAPGPDEAGPDQAG